MLLLKTNLLLMLFYGFYRLLFVRDTFFKLRRVTLMAMLAAAFVVPLVDIGWWVEEHASTVNLVEAYQEVMLPTVVVTGDMGRFPWMRLCSAIYMIGVAVLLTRVLVQLLAIFRRVRTSERMELMDSEVCRMDDDTSPFSFFKWIFVNPNAQNESQLREIMVHEQTHVRQWHSVDILLMELCSILCWWNPFVWLMRREVRLNLEFLADDHVVTMGSERKSYQYHLLGLAYGKNVATISNNFNVLPLKLRIKMMNKKRTNGLGRTKYVLVPAVAVALLVASNIESVARTWNGAKASVVTENMNEVVWTTPADTIPDGVFDVVEKMPEFPGGMPAMMQFLQQNMKYPEEAAKKGIQGRVMVKFVVDASGKVRDVELARGVDPLLDAEALRVIKMMPDWIPGMQKGHKVHVKYTVPIAFRLPDDKPAGQK
ncbi:MAG: M56 family metallopeptidase [Prevotella sp.]|nr:M56 family metallopeptidase [Prevotella sp.]